MRKLKLFSRAGAVGASAKGREGSRPDSLSLVSRQSVLAMLLVLLTSVFGVGNAWGEEKEYTFTAVATPSAAETDGFTFTFDKGNGSTAPAWNSGSSEARLYAKGSLTIDGGDNTITSIVFDYAVNKNKSGKAPTISSVSGATNLGSWNEETKTWSDATGDSKIVFATGGDAGNIGFKSVTITYTGSSNPGVLKSITVSDDLTNKDYETADALNLAGLTVTGSYDDDSKKEITSGITWKVRTNSTSEAVNLDAYTLTAGQTSVEVQATVNEVSSDWKTITGLTVTAASPKITITQNEVTDFTNTYAEYSWTAAGVSGKMYAYKNSGMQFNSAKTGYYVYNTDPIPGRITKITMIQASGTARDWTPYVSTTAMTSASGTALEAKSVTTSGASWDVTGSNRYFYLTVAGGSTVIGSIVIEYTEETPPAVEAPSISGDENFVGSTSVSISHADADHIYYTTNGDAPTTSSTEYTEPFELTNTATVKAIAIKGSDESAVAEKTFTKATILTVAQAKAAIDAGGDLSNKYVAGIVSQIDSYNSTYNSLTYWISDDGTTTNQLEVYSGLAGVVKTAFASTDDIHVGDDVTVKGTLKKYNSTYEFDKNNVIVAYKQIALLSWDPTSYDAELGGSNSFPTLTNTNSVSVTYSSSNTDAATINASTGAIELVAEGSTTITATFAGNENYKANSASYTLNVASSVIRADISFEENGGSAVADLTQQTNLPNPLPAITKAGKNFGGWFMDSEFNTPAGAGDAVTSTDAITLFAKWNDPYTVAEALAIINAMEINEETDSKVYVSGIITPTERSYSDTYRSITYMISDDGTATDELKVYSGKGVDDANFSAVTDLQDADEVVVYGKLKRYQKNNTSPIEQEVNQPNYIYSFNRPAKPTITADPAEVTNVVAEGVTNQTIALTYENIENYLVEVTLHDDAEGTEAFSDTWLTASVSDADNYATITYSVAANEGAARTAYMKVYAIGDNDKEATKIIAVSQEAYVAPAEPASLPFAFNEGRADIATTQGMSQEGLDSDYGSSPKLKFNTTGDYVIINIASDPGKLTYDIKGNNFSDGTFKVQESADGETYTGVAEYTELGDVQSEEKTLLQTTRYVKFIYTEKVKGNVALGNIAIAAPVAVEAPTFSPEGGAYTGTQSVELSCITDGATIYYTTNGNDPDDSSTEYTAAISVDETMTIKAIAYKGNDHSEIASAAYTITPALTDYYEKVSSGAVAEGTYLIVYEDASVAFNGGLETLDAVSNTIAVDITNDNKIAKTSTTEAATFYIDPTAGTIKSASGRYIGRTANSNGLNASETEAYTNTISIDGDGNAVIVGSSSTATYLRYNPSQGQTRFRYFAQNQSAIQLYKLHGEVIKPASGLAWDPAGDIEITVGDAFSAPALLNPNGIDAAEITIASSNTDVATIENGVVTLVANATGTTTITATFAGNASYKPATVSYKIKVNPAHSIYVSPSLNVNFNSVQKDATVEDQVITVTLTGVDAATLTLEGTGAIAFTISAAALTASGDVTISASSATAGTFAATLTISDDANQAESKVVNLSLTVNEVEDEETSKTWDLTIASYVADPAPTTELIQWTGTYVFMKNERNGNSNTAVNNYIPITQNSTRFYKNNKVTITPNGKEITSVVFTATSVSYANALQGSEWTNASASVDGTTVTVTPTDGKNAIIAVVGGTCGFTAVQVNYKPVYENIREGAGAGKYYTICLSKKVVAFRGGSFWTLKKRSASVAYLEEVKVTGEQPLPAGTPYIFSVSDKKLEVVYEGKATNTAQKNYALRGTFTDLDQDDIDGIAQTEQSDIYLLSDNKLWNVSNFSETGSSNNEILAGRAYIVFNDLELVTEAPQSVPGRRVVAMPMHKDNTTGIDAVNMNVEGVQKVVVDGHMYIVRDGKMFDATGRLVK